MYSDSQSGKRGKLFAKPRIMWLVACLLTSHKHNSDSRRYHYKASQFKFIFSRKEKRNKSPNPFSSPCPIELSALRSPFHSLDVIDSPKPIQMYRRSTLLSRYLTLPRVQHRSFASFPARSFAPTHITMSDSTSGVSSDLVKSKLIEQLQAQHVEIEDLSGMTSVRRVHQYILLYWTVSANALSLVYRWLRTGFSSGHCFAPV